MKTNLTVGIPCYNCFSTLEKTLQSINIQTLKPYEVILLDDNSTEDYKNILEKFPELNIRHIKTKENKGVGSARATIVDETKTKYLTMIDADDYFFHVNVL
jgi:glycosyltransferase involved in cell wall biosynthesis